MSNLSPLKAVRARCLWCQGGIAEPYETTDGEWHRPHRPFRDVDTCPTTRRGGSKHNRSRPTSLTRLCEVSECELLHLRTGKNPRRAKRAVR